MRANRLGSGRPARTLRVAHAIGTPQMSTATGDPIWPYDDTETLVALIHIAELFDSSIAEEKPHTVVDAIPRRWKGTVMAVGDKTNDAGLLYAHLTNRRFEVARDSAFLLKRQPDVVVVSVDRLTPNFLQQLYSQPGWAPGLITGESPRVLLRQALLRSAAAYLCGGTSGRHLDIYPFAELGQINLGNREILGRLVDPAELRKALERGSELLSVFTVGDGIDANLGPLTLCPMGQKPASLEGAAPACIVSDTCHRLQLPLTEALDSARLVSPEGIAARVLIFHACWGIQPDGSLYSPAWGYGYRLAAHDRLGAMLTTWRVTIGSSADTEVLARYVACGMTVGAALARFNSLASSRRKGQLMCLLGDPKIRAHTGTHATIMRKLNRRNRVHEENQRQLAFLAAYLDMMPLQQGALHAAARDAIAECQRSAWSGLPNAPTSPPSGSVFRQAMLEWLTKQGTIPAYHWMKFADPVSAKDSSFRCFACDQSAQEVNFRLRIVGAGSRTVYICPRCGLIEDRPAKMERIGITIKEGMAYLHRAPTAVEWAGTMLYRPNVGPNVSRSWPSAEDGQPLSRIEIFEPSESRGAGQLLLFMIEGASLSMARAVYSTAIE